MLMVMPIHNIFADIPGQLPEELTQTLLDRKSIRVERIVSQGHISPEGSWYDQNEHEWVLLLQGSAGLLFDGEDEAQWLKPGDFILIPAHRRHRVAWTAHDADTVWLAIFFE